METAERMKRKAQMLYDPELIAERLREVLGDVGTRGNTILNRDGVLSPSSIGAYRRGEFAPTARTLQTICSYFGVSADYILGLSSIKEIPKKWEYNHDCEIWACPHCGGIGTPEFEFCPHCGRQVNTS